MSEHEARPATALGRSRRRPLAAVVLVALLALGWVAFTGIGPFGGGRAPTPPPQPQPSETPSTPSPTPSPTTWTIDGLPVRTVGEVLTLRERGGLRDEPVVLRGYWSYRFMHLCSVPMGRPGALEIYCSDDEFGITERREPILDFTGGGRQPATGPSLTPFVDESAYRTNVVFALAAQRFELPPVAIVIRGHFDDPRASDCRPEARQLCLDRLVVDRILSFDLAAALERTPPLVELDFGSETAPPAPFGAADCEGIDEFGFVGWTEPEALVRQDGGLLAYAMVSKDPVTLRWTDDPSRAGHRARLGLKLMCVGWSNEKVGLVDKRRGPLLYYPSLYLERDDGLIIPIGPYAPSDGTGP
jgi:hypothetical protein